MSKQKDKEGPQQDDLSIPKQSQVSVSEPQAEISAEKQVSWEEKVQNLTQEVANDCKLKKKTSAKFIKHMEEANKLWESRKEEPTSLDYQLLAGLYKNLGKLGQQEECLEKSLVLLRKGGGGPPGTFVRWTLQLTAMKSSSQKHNQCYDLAVRASTETKKAIKSLAESPQRDIQSKLLAQLILDLAEQQTKDQVLWLYNDKSLEQHLLSSLRQKAHQNLALPFYPQIEFHISDIMTLQACKIGWQKNNGSGLKELITYLSISYFTMATEKYYSQDYSFKYCHIKSLKMALAAFDVSCTYVGFLVKILQQHFGQRLQAITEETTINGEHSDLVRYLPKDTKEVKLTDLAFCDE